MVTYKPTVTKHSRVQLQKDIRLQITASFHCIVFESIQTPPHLLNREISEGHLSSYLSQAAFLLHVFLDIVPDATLGEEVTCSDLFKLLVAAISLQGKLHDVHRLQEV